MSPTRPPGAGSAKVNLHCASCNAQIGIFENEWLRLTSSYARAQSLGVHFSTRIDEETQIVPPGVAQKAAEGCAMSEVFCNKCSSMVGQYCRSAPSTDKHALVNQHFYKLSRTYLKNSESGKREEPVFGFSGDLTKPTTRRPPQTSLNPRANSHVPNARWSETPLRTMPKKANALLRPSRRTREMVIDTEEDYDTAEESAGHSDSNGQIDKMRDLEAAVGKNQLKLLHLQKEARSVNSNLDARITLFESVTDDHDSKLSEQETKIFAQNRRLALQEATIAAQDEKVDRLSRQIESLQDNLSDLKASVAELTEQRRDQRRVNKEDFLEAFGTLFHDMRNTHVGEAQIYALQRENHILREKVQWVSSALNFPPEHQAAMLSSSPTYNGNAALRLGKRKRDVHPLAVHEDPQSAASNGRPEQLPTPQSSASSQSHSAQAESRPAPALVWAKSPANARTPGQLQAPRLLAPSRIVSYADTREIVHTSGMALHTFPPKLPPPMQNVPPQPLPNEDNFVAEKPENFPPPRKRARPSQKKTVVQDRNNDKTDIQDKANDRPAVEPQRSVAPTPEIRIPQVIQYPKTNLEVRSVGIDPVNIDIDSAVIITPDNFDDLEETLFEKDILPPPVVEDPQWEWKRRRLNAELRRLGLEEWITKDRNSSEYRAAVQEARLKDREEKRKTLLEKAGVPTEPGDTSDRLSPPSDQPETPNGHVNDIPHHSPLFVDGDRDDGQSTTPNDGTMHDAVGLDSGESRATNGSAETLDDEPDESAKTLDREPNGRVETLDNEADESAETLDHELFGATDESQDDSYLDAWTRKPSKELSTRAEEIRRRDQMAQEAMEQESEDDSD